MRKEINPAGREIYPAPQTGQPQEHTTPQGQEISPPAPEIPDCPAEYFDQDTLGDRQATPSKKGKRRLLRQMVYMVACAVTVVSLAQTLPNGSEPWDWPVAGPTIVTDWGSLGEETVAILMELGIVPELWEELPEQERIALLEQIGILGPGDSCGGDDIGGTVNGGTNNGGYDDSCGDDCGGWGTPIAPVQSTYYFVYDDVQIYMNAQAQPVLDALGAPLTYTEEYSCATDDYMKTYGYQGMYMQVYTVDGIDYIYCLWSDGPGLETAEGLGVGATRQRLKELYPSVVNDISTYFFIDRDGCSLIVMLDGDEVTSIQCEAFIYW